jgi:hypothetical protein
MTDITTGSRVGYTVMYDVKPNTRYVTEYGRVTSMWPEAAPAMARIAVENPQPGRARYVTRKMRDIELAEPEPKFRAGQRVRLPRDSRATGRVTGTGVFPGGTGIEITMDNRYSPRPTPVRYHTLGGDFELLPDDYLDDTKAMEHIAAILAPSVPVNEMLAEILGVLRRNGRTRHDPPGQ